MIGRQKPLPLMEDMVPARGPRTIAQILAAWMVTLPVAALLAAAAAGAAAFLRDRRPRWPGWIGILKLDWILELPWNSIP